MSTLLAQAQAEPELCLNPSVYVADGEVNFGATSIASIDFPDPGITFTRASAGVYTGAYPACLKMRMLVQIKSAALTVEDLVVTAKSATAGTWGFSILKGGVATDPANGDQMSVTFRGETRTR